MPLNTHLLLQQLPRRILTGNGFNWLTNLMICSFITIFFMLPFTSLTSNIIAPFCRLTIIGQESIQLLIMLESWTLDLPFSMSVGWSNIALLRYEMFFYCWCDNGGLTTPLWLLIIRTSISIRIRRNNWKLFKLKIHLACIKFSCIKEFQIVNHPRE